MNLQTINLCRPVYYTGFSAPLETVTPKFSTTRQAIFDIVTYYSGITKEQMQSPSRKRHITIGRYVAMYFIRTETNMQYKLMGLLFNRHHATIIHAVLETKGLSKFDPEFAKLFNNVKSLL